MATDFQGVVEQGNIDDYEIVRKISTLGRGKYAELFEGIDVTDFRRCIIKSPNPMGRKRVRREMEILRALRGGPNILECLDVVWDPCTESSSIIFDYFENTDYRALYPRFDTNDNRYYMRELLKALEFCHRQQIMHRDVRPPNIMIDHNQRKLRLFGWDYAEYYVPHTQYSVRAGRFFRPPELLLDYEEYDCSVDMWNLGSMFASMIFRRDPFFHGNSRFDQIEKIASVLGTKGLFNYIERYDMDGSDQIDGMQVFEQRAWSSFVNEENSRLVDDCAIDLVDKLLRWDHKERITARQALEHAYFTGN
ncbi:Casein kinase II subunit alpha [Cladobotryum mycophilum]|uniref:non-specific serine/threonine protein kinase n=1 Tax=Cladobotryum mycophilum TaxID=491253 RepID=A0ABR0SNV8_9HYPO